MQIAIDIPDDIEGVIAPGQNAARAALEALAVEGYRSDRLTEYDVQQLLGFDDRFAVHDFLKQHEAYMHYTMEDIERDTERGLQAALKARPELKATRELRG